MSSKYCLNLKKKFALLPLLVKYKWKTVVILQSNYSSWKLYTKESKEAKFMTSITAYIIRIYGLELVTKLREIAIYKNIRRLQRKKLFYLIYPLLKKILMKKGLFFNIWLQKSKFIKVSNPIKPIKSFFQLIKRKLASGKEAKMKGLVCGVHRVMKKYFIRKLKSEAKRRFMIYYVFLLRKSLKGHVHEVFKCLINSYYKTISSEGNERHLKGKKRLVRNIKKTENDKGISSNKKMLKQHKMKGFDHNEECINNDLYELVLFTILKIVLSRWKKKIKSINFKSSKLSSLKSIFIKCSRIISKIFLKNRLENETWIINKLKNQEINSYDENDTTINQASSHLIDHDQLPLKQSVKILQLTSENNKISLTLNNLFISYLNINKYHFLTTLSQMSSLMKLGQIINPKLRECKHIFYSKFIDKNQFRHNIRLFFLKKLNMILFFVNQKQQFQQYMKEKILLSHAKAIHSELFAFVKWSLMSKFDRLTKDKMKSLYHNFQSTYLKTLGEMKDIESSFSDNNIQLNCYDYSFKSLKHCIDRRIDSSFGKNILFS